ncbi:hypothetical protein GEMRC1_006877 [Eukaryota sp. GEM-RC1]
MPKNIPCQRDQIPHSVAYALVFNVCGIFSIPYSIHNDNGPEFANATFNAVCQLLAIDNTTYIPHFSQSNGLVERRHRDVLRNLQRFLIDFGTFDNWTEYLPFVQLQLNATKNRYTEHTPYELISSKTATKLHGKHSGPFLVIELLSSSSLTIKNLVSGIESQASVHQCKRYHSDLLSDHGIHQQVAAGDKEEHVITEVLDQFDSPEGPMCSVLWYGGDITAVATSSIKNTKAFMAFKKNNNNPCIDQRKRSSSKANPDKTPIANRTRRRTGSKKEKK